MQYLSKEGVKWPYMDLNKVESICVAMDCTLTDILEFVPDNTEEE